MFRRKLLLGLVSLAVLAGGFVPAAPAKANAGQRAYCDVYQYWIVWQKDGTDQVYRGVYTVRVGWLTEERNVRVRIPGDDGGVVAEAFRRDQEGWTVIDGGELYLYSEWVAW